MRFTYVLSKAPPGSGWDVTPQTPPPLTQFTTVAASFNLLFIVRGALSRGLAEKYYADMKMRTNFSHFPCVYGFNTQKQKSLFQSISWRGLEFLLLFVKAVLFFIKHKICLIAYTYKDKLYIATANEYATQLDKLTMAGSKTIGRKFEPWWYFPMLFYSDTALWHSRDLGKPWINLSTWVKLTGKVFLV